MAPLTNTMAVLAGLASVGMALPSTKIGTVKVPEGNTFDLDGGKMSLKQVHREGHVHRPVMSIYKTYLKFGVPVPAALQETVDGIRASMTAVKRATGSVKTTPVNEYDDAYTIPVSIGTPAQVLNLDLDTGSSDFWVFSTLMPSSQVDGQTVWNPNKSSTAKPVSGSTWDVSYGDGSQSSGSVYTDKVTIAGLTVTQSVEAAKKVSASFTEDPFDGVIGMGFDNINNVSPNSVPTFFDNVKSQLNFPLFAADLKYEAAGSYDFGFTDSSKYTGSITYTSVNPGQGYWTFTSSGYAVGSSSFKLSSITGIADTGTTLLYLPTSVVKAYYAQVSGSRNNEYYGGYVFKCNTTTLPSFTYGVGSARITIPGKYLNAGQATPGSSICIGGLQSSDDYGINIFGDVALKAAYVVFKNDGSSPQLGFASKETLH